MTSTLPTSPSSNYPGKAGFSPSFFSSGKIYMVTAPVDFRKGMDSLTLIAKGLGLDLTTNHEYWVVFISKVCKAVKIIHADLTGIMLLNRKLHHGTFQRLLSQRNGPAVCEITAQELNGYLDGERVQVQRNNLTFSG